MTKSHPSPRWHRSGGHPARRVSLCGRYAWSVVVGWAMVPFLSAHGNAQGRCDSPTCDCRDGQATPCDAVGGIGSRPFHFLMLPSLAEATLRNSDRLGNSIESTTLKWIERTKQLSARWRFSDSSCDAGGPNNRACGSEHPPITSAPVDDVEAEKASPLHPQEWTELPTGTSGPAATPQTPVSTDSPLWMRQTPEVPELPHPNKQNPLIDPFLDDPQPAAPIVPSVQGQPLGKMLRRRDNESATPSSAIDVPPVWIATRDAAHKRAAAAIDLPQQSSADSDPAPSELIRQASDAQPIRDPVVSPSSNPSVQAPRNKKRPKPFESSQRGPMPAQAALSAPPQAATLQPDTKPLPTPTMQSYEEFAKRLQASRSTDRRTEEPAGQPTRTSSSTRPSAASEEQSGSTQEPLPAAPPIPVPTTEPPQEEAAHSALPELSREGADSVDAGELPAIAAEVPIRSTLPESMGDEGNELPQDDADGSSEANQSNDEGSTSAESVRPSEDAGDILDARITQRILNQLQIAMDQGSLKQFELDVSTVGGEVWVRGFVSRPEHKKLIFDTIQQVPGIVVVIDDVSVARPMPAPRKQESAEESFGEAAAEEEPTPKVSKSSESAKAPERGLALPKWLRPKATGGGKENTDFRSTLQSPAASSQPQGSAALTPRVRTRGAFGASGGSDRTLGAAPLSSPVVPAKPNPPGSIDRTASERGPIAGPTEERDRQGGTASMSSDRRSDIDRKTKARLAATAARIDQPTAGSAAPSNLSVPTPPAASGEAPAAATPQGTNESTSEQGLDLNSFLQRVNAAKQSKGQPE